jgi:hypothetical protein
MNEQIKSTEQRPKLTPQETLLFAEMNTVDRLNAISPFCLCPNFLDCEFLRQGKTCADT